MTARRKYRRLFSLFVFNSAELRQVSTIEVKDRREKGPMKLNSGGGRKDMRLKG